MSNRKTTEVRDPIELISGGTKDQFAIQPRPKKKRPPKAKANDTGPVVGNKPGGRLTTQFHPLAQQFDITDEELQFVDAVLADPYRNATAAYMLLHPGTIDINGAKVNAMRILNDPNVRSYQIWCVENNHTAQVVSREFVLLRLRHVAERAMGATPVFDKDGQPTGEYKCDFNAANKALELLGKQQGMFKEDSRVRIKHDRPLLTINVQGREDKSTEPVPTAREEDE